MFCHFNVSGRFRISTERRRNIPGAMKQEKNASLDVCDLPQQKNLKNYVPSHATRIPHGRREI